MKKRFVIQLYDENGKSRFYDEKEDETYESSEVIAGILRRPPNESYIFKPKGGKVATIVLRNRHTKALAFVDDGTSIGTRKELPKELRERLDEGDVFFCAWADPYDQMHLIWIEHMKKKYQNCLVSIAGYDAGEASVLARGILKAMVQTKVAFNGAHKEFLDKEFNISESGISQIDCAED